MKLCFFLSLYLLAHTWAVYPIALWVANRFGKKRGNIGEGTPTVTVVLTAHNEAKKIGARLRNLKETNYPSSLLEIIVASDASTDPTDEIVSAFHNEDPQITLRKCQGGGKTAAQNETIPLAKGEIVILTDAGTLFTPNTIGALARRFSDPKVGCVGGMILLKSEDSTVSESQGVYWKFEMLLRKLESSCGVLHTASGGVMAFRKSLFKPVETRFGDDCAIPLDVVLSGHRVIHDEEAAAYDSFPSTVEAEFRTRVRMTVRNLTCTLNRLAGLNPVAHPLLFVSALSHKVMRWLTPFFLIAALVSNALISGDNPVFFAFLVAQISFYALGLVGWLANLLGFRIPLASQIFSFLLANAGFFVGALKASVGHEIERYGKHA
jgi:poly-beta-1,6-N-acetyl-D-glucosamine synthase